jgi:hypothetical protein
MRLSTAQTVDVARSSSAAMRVEVQRSRRSCSMSRSVSGKVRPGTWWGAEDRSVMGSPASKRSSQRKQVLS